MEANSILYDTGSDSVRKVLEETLQKTARENTLINSWKYFLRNHWISPREELLKESLDKFQEKFLENFLDKLREISPEKFLPEYRRALLIKFLKQFMK